MYTVAGYYYGNPEEVTHKRTDSLLQVKSLDTITGHVTS